MTEWQFCARGEWSHWHLATYSGSGSYQELIATAYNSKTGGGLTNGDTNIQYSPLSFVYAGYYYYRNGNLDYRGDYGYYWESMVYNATDAYYLFFYSTRLGPQYNNGKGYGRSIRCTIY